jgi:hypothetical protein
MNLSEAARVLGISARTLRLAAERGEIEAIHPLGDGPWVFRCEVLQGRAGATLVARVRGRNHQAAIPNPLQRDRGFSST